MLRIGASVKCSVMRVIYDGGLGKKENYLKPDEQRVAVIKHVLNTSITDCEPQLGVCCLALAACIESPQRGTFCVPTWFYIMIKLE